jgi:hypothetical protein
MSASRLDSLLQLQLVQYSDGCLHQKEHNRNDEARTRRPKNRSRKDEKLVTNGKQESRPSVQKNTLKIKEGSFASSLLEEKEETKLEENCAICYGEIDFRSLDSRRITKLSCGHSFHTDCLESQIKARWSGPRITFEFMKCALCRDNSIEKNRCMKKLPYMREFKDLRENIHRMALDKAKEENLKPSGSENSEFNDSDLLEHAMKVLAFYECVHCKSPFCGGLVECAAQMDIDASVLRCPSCLFLEDCGVKDLRCREHGYKHAMFKCDSCCAMATFDCINNHYCERCHGEAYKEKKYPCPGLEKCPLGIAHPPNLSAVHGSNSVKPFVIGCMKCVGMEEENQVFNIPEDWAF